MHPTGGGIDVFQDGSVSRSEVEAYIPYINLAVVVNLSRASHKSQLAQTTVDTILTPTPAPAPPAHHATLRLCRKSIKSHHDYLLRAQKSLCSDSSRHFSHWPLPPRLPPTASPLTFGSIKMEPSPPCPADHRPLWASTTR